MADKHRFLLRLDQKVHAALEKWAADDMRSLNAQIEYLLADALKRAGRYKDTLGDAPGSPNPTPTAQEGPTATAAPKPAPEEGAPQDGAPQDGAPQDGA
jgi:hypothetical protein